MVRTLPYGSAPRLDASRILAFAGVIAVHAFAFLLLLVPLAAPQPQAVPEESGPRPWVQPVVVAAPPAPRIMPTAQPPQTHVHRPQPAALPQAPAAASNPVVVDNGSLAAGPATEKAVAADTDTFPTGPVSLGQLAYAEASAPPYPRDALHARIEGTVLLKVLVDTDGTPLQATLERSSGNRSLDREALRHVLKHWRFQPAMRDGRAVQAYGLVPIVFALR